MPEQELRATKFELDHDGVAVVTLSRPEALNALNGALNGELIRHFERCDTDTAV